MQIKYLSHNNKESIGIQLSIQIGLRGLSHLKLIFLPLNGKKRLASF